MDHEITITGKRLFDADEYTMREAFCEIMDEAREKHGVIFIEYVSFEEHDDGYEYRIEATK
jgi:predicted AAA+ superfamily ATPase